jgi:D-alanyl-D-alanine carboxypeptidase (penicillin-binding protein 5/6)
MLLPSGDNVADSLAIWAFGSLANYQSYANQYLKSVSLDQTTVGSDASGFAPSSETSASNLVSIGELVAKNPVISQIVAEPSAGSIPVVGTIHNVNYLLGTKHIDGIKTGNTDQAGGVFLSSSKIMLNNQPTTVFTAIMGARTLWDALNSSSYLVVSAQNNFSLAPSFKDVKAGSIVGGYIIPWSKQRIDAISSGSVAGLSWGGTKVNGTVNLKTISFNYKSGQQVGNIYTQDKLSNHQTNTPVIIKQTIPKPSKWWLVFHPAYVI